MATKMLTQEEKGKTTLVRSATIVESSSLSAFGWEAATGLDVTFASGDRYQYPEVSASIYVALLMEALLNGSIGALFDKLVKKTGFGFKKLAPSRTASV